MIKSTLYACIMGAFFATCATAADVPMKAAPTVVRASSLFDWSGFQAGADLGYLRATHETDLAIAGLNIKAKPAGFIYGGHILAQHHFANNFVAGVGLSLFGSSADDTVGVGGASVKERIRDMAFADFRLGYALNNVPLINSALIYGTVGLAAARSDATISGGGGSITSNKMDNYGWSIGAGIDTAITANVIWNVVNFRYFDLGTGRASFAVAPGIGIDVPVDQKGFIVTTGLSWKFATNAPLGF